MSLKEYVTLGRSGLRVSPLCLGTMTFGTEWGWGVQEDVSRGIFDRYIELGGNFLIREACGNQTQHLDLAWG